ncbi:MAG: WG repeat-containing protein [Thermonemataceae bacterium]
MDSTGKAVIPAKFDAVKEFQEGVAAAQENGQWGFIRQDGEWLIEPAYEELYSFLDGLAAFAETENGKLGFLNEKGQVVILPTYDFVKPFQGGLAAVSQGDRWHFINKEGEKVFENSFSYAENFHEGLAVVQNADGAFQYINEKGDYLTDDAYLLAQNFQENWALVADGIQGAEDQPDSLIYHFINAQGKVQLTNLPYDIVTPFSEGLAGVALTEGQGQDTLLVGIIDKKGREVVAPTYESTYGIVFVHYQEGLSPVMEDNTWGYLNKKGALAIPIQYQEAGNFKNGLALVKKEDKIYYINPKGEQIGKEWEYDTNTTFVLNFQR